MKYAVCNFLQCFCTYKLQYCLHTMIQLEHTNGISIKKINQINDNVLKLDPCETPLTTSQQVIYIQCLIFNQAQDMNKLFSGQMCLDKRLEYFTLIQAKNKFTAFMLLYWVCQNARNSKSAQISGCSKSLSSKLSTLTVRKILKMIATIASWGKKGNK